MSPRATLAYVGVVLGPRRTLVAAALPVALATAWVAWVDPEGIDQAVALALFAQMFAAATGYRERACRGHFDGILTLDSPRATVAAIHALLSIGPGVATWWLVAGAAWLVRPSEWPSCLTASGLAALVYISCAAWACALPLTRYASGVLWIATLFGLAGTGHLGSLRDIFVASDTSWMASLSKAGAALICPFFLMSDPRAAGALALGVVLFFSALLVASGVRFIVNLDVPLRDPS